LKRCKILLTSLLVLLLIAFNSFAGDFDWMKDFNLKAEVDSSGFRARLETRFQVGDFQIKAVLGSVDEPSDAYMMLCLGEISNQPVEHVIERYNASKGKGWGTIAKSLGIKPGSKEFQSLKQSQDLYDNNEKRVAKVTSKGKGKHRK